MVDGGLTCAIFRSRHGNGGDGSLPQSQSRYRQPAPLASAGWEFKRGSESRMQKHNSIFSRRQWPSGPLRLVSTSKQSTFVLGAGSMFLGPFICSCCGRRTLAVFGPLWTCNRCRSGRMRPDKPSPQPRVSLRDSSTPTETERTLRATNFDV
jgi:hypothetical protein